MVAHTQSLAPEALKSVADVLCRGDSRDPVAFLREAIRTVPGPVTLGTAFGKEGCVLVHLISSHSLPIDIFTLDTGLFFEETYALWRALEARYHVRIRAVKPRETPEEQAQRLGPSLWERQANRCCHLRKVVPLRSALANAKGWVTGVRRSHSLVRREAPLATYDAAHDVVKLNPLVAWSDTRLDDYIKTHDIPINPLHAQGYPSIGCAPCTSQVSAGEDPRAGRWRGQSKTECGIHDSFLSQETADER